MTKHQKIKIPYNEQGTNHFRNSTIQDDNTDKQLIEKLQPKLWKAITLLREFQVLIIELKSLLHPFTSKNEVSDEK